MGPPSEFTPEIGDAICERIAEGETLKAICRDEGMPNFVTVYRWMDRFPEFAAAMEFARKVGYDAIADDSLEIADNASGDYVPSDKGLAFNPENVQRSKLRVWTRHQLLAKWHPKKYGDKVAVGGAEDLPPIRTAAELTDAQLAAIAAGGSR